MNTLHTLFSSLRHSRVARPSAPASMASVWAQNRFRHSMLGESGIHEVMRLFGVGR